MRDSLKCAVMPNSTMDGWCQDGSPCPCGPCTEMRVQWVTQAAAGLDKEHDFFVCRLNTIIGAYRDALRCIQALRLQVLELEREKTEASNNLFDSETVDAKIRDELRRLKKDLERKKNILDHVYDLLEPVGDLMIDIEQELR